jgi:CheY-like chemotaxis protein
MDRKQRLRVLLIDDSEADTERLLRKLAAGGYDPVSIRVENAQALSRAMLYGTWDLAVCDYSMPSSNGAERIKQVKAQSPQLPFMFVSGTFRPNWRRNSRTREQRGSSPRQPGQLPARGRHDPQGQDRGASAAGRARYGGVPQQERARMIAQSERAGADHRPSLRARARPGRRKAARGAVGRALGRGQDPAGRRPRREPERPRGAHVRPRGDDRPRVLGPRGAGSGFSRTTTP